MCDEDSEDTVKGQVVRGVEVARPLELLICGEHRQCAVRVDDAIAAEAAYQHGRFEEARGRASELLSGATDSALTMIALTEHMLSGTMTGDSAGACADLRRLARCCDEAMRHPEDRVRFGVGILGALRVETLLMADVFDATCLEAGIGAIDESFRPFLGRLLSLRSFRKARYQEATGIAYAFSKMLSPDLRAIGISLDVSMAASCLAEGRLDEALEHFDSAWDASGKTGIIMPLVEMGFLLFGLNRSSAKVGEDERCKEMESYVRNYNQVWFEMRGRLGLSTLLEPLTLLEGYVAGLADMGWKNRQIARHLCISENTVKHQLTSVYQKLGVQKRSDLSSIRYEMFDASPNLGLVRTA